MEGGMRGGDFKNPNFATLQWTGENLAVVPRLVFKKPNFTSLSWIEKNWEIQIEQYLEIPKSLRELETTYKYSLRATLKNPNFTSMDEIGKIRS